MRDRRLERKTWGEEERQTGTRKKRRVWSHDGLNRDGEGRRDGEEREDSQTRGAQETTDTTTATGERTGGGGPARKEERKQSQSRMTNSKARETEDWLRLQHGGGLQEEKTNKTLEVLHTNAYSRIFTQNCPN